jgi:hypothetical protein
MDKIKTLEDFKNLVAKEEDYFDYDDIGTPKSALRITDEAARLYAEYCCQQQRILCWNNSKINCGPMLGVMDQYLATDELNNEHGISVDSDSILNAPLFVHQSK